ncbi:transporter [Arenimonas sp.]|uniref:transporter n=1 Tax=Arenimonas sp. TaxID=1872635 RepID=UPI0039E56472
MKRLLMTLMLLSAGTSCLAQDVDDVAKQLSNPISSLISVPMQFNFERGAGLDGEGERLRLNVQPVIPMSIGEDWNLISRTIVPIIDQQDVFPDGSRQAGVGNTLQSLFFSPKELTPSGWTWGIGPAFLLPTASDERLGSDRWAIGPTVVALRQTRDGWTYGGLANHLVSVGGGDDRDINATYLQPFVAKRISPGRTVSMSLEASYDWESQDWTAPLHLGISQVIPARRQMFSIQGGVFRYLESTPGAADWGLRFTLTLLYPKR